ncbi:hypothetical protein CN423_02060 [Bacillus cereus]|nr:hypothetical protein CN501_16385 [Bacillus cereus]PEV68914.1 hypothetical protein CN423_02060 [Bacillus cereus]PFO95075.1 hypothetical protein COJ88_13855 [Bacillus cereus]PFT80487.1 hypothetical protein COK74_17750 [Bacillus cereus]PGQ00648.1 hypothetical protein COA02_05700 [Bacillus cereus]
MKKECRILQINRMGRKKLSRFILHYVNIDAVFKAIYLFFATPSDPVRLINRFVVACLFQK